jgi:hypothetical protein
MCRDSMFERIDSSAYPNFYYRFLPMVSLPIREGTHMALLSRSLDESGARVITRFFLSRQEKDALHYSVLDCWRLVQLLGAE